MSLSVMVVGAYGNFGSIISRRLAREAGIDLVLVGRAGQVLALAQELAVRSWQGDALGPDFVAALSTFEVDLVIHTAGPFQGQDHHVARACVEAGAHYCDLSDARDFVATSVKLDEAARARGVAVLSGCSSVPSLSAAVLDAFLARMGEGFRIETLHYGITSSAKMPGLSTIKGVLSYAGRPIPQWRHGRHIEVPGWQGLHWVKIEGIRGRRLVADVDVPDMALFPDRYGVRDVRFKAGPGLALGTLANYLLAQLVRTGLVADTERAAYWLHRLGRGFERFGNGKSAFYLELTGQAADGRPVTYRWQLLAVRDKGPQIPCCAAIALARKMAAGYRPAPGARICVGEIALQEYLDEIGPSFVTVTERQQ
ncbi:MAG: saccharopine dehydrogenase NADP-binding domain-containing protein [Pseudomonas oryzihabitans]